MSQRSEDDAERTACLPIAKHLRICDQCLVVGRVDAGQLRCAILLKKGTDLSSEAQAGLVRKDGSDLFESQFGFGRRSIVMASSAGAVLNISARVSATSLIVAGCGSQISDYQFQFADFAH